MPRALTLMLNMAYTPGFFASPALPNKKKGHSWQLSHQGKKECARRVCQGRYHIDKMNTEGKYRYSTVGFTLIPAPWYLPYAGRLTRKQLQRAGL